MNNSNRRAFLKVAGVTSAAAGAAVVVPAAALAPPSAKTESAAGSTLPAAASGAMVAYIDDVSTGEISVMVEGREVTVTDHQLVATLAHALHSAPSSRSV